MYKKVQFTDDVKQPSEASMMCTINGDTFFSFTKNTWIGDFSASSHITNDDTNIKKLIQGSSSTMPATKKGKLLVNVQQVDGTERVKILSPMKIFPKVGTNLFSLTWKLWQGNKIPSDHQKLIVVCSTNGNIILDC